MKQVKKVKLPEINEFYKLSSNDYPKAVEIMGKTFRDDPIWNDILKDDLDKFRYVFGAPLKLGMKYGVVYAPSPNLEGIAVWMESSKADINFWRIIRSGVISVSIKLGSKIMKRMMTDLEQLAKDRQNLIKPPYYYLYLLGVKDELKGQGIGTKLVRTFIENAPKDIPFYLETETESNVKFYERLGFNVMNIYHVPSNNLPMWEMIHLGRK